jgi:hypothetical protein
MRILTLLCALVVYVQSYADPSISGYFNTEYFDKETSEPYYDMHHFNIMIAHEIGKFRMFAELEFEHAPSQVDGGVNSRGKILSERAWGEFNHNNYFNVRMGQMLNGTLYQQNHYPSITPNIARPQLVKKIFDGDLEGIRFFGDIGYGLKYEVEKGQAPGTTDKKHLGFALSYGLNAGGVDVEVTARSATYHTAGAGADTDPTATGFELNLNWKDLTIWAESAAKTNTDESVDATGTYAILSYEFDLGKPGTLTPFYLHDSFHDKPATTDAIVKSGIGLTYRPEPQISIKLENLSTAEYDSVEATSQWGIGFVYFYN